MVRNSPATTALPPASGWIRDSGYALLLSSVFWLIWIQNLPDHLSGYSGELTVDNFAGPSIFGRSYKLIMIGVGVIMILWRRRLAMDLLRQTNPGALALLSLAIVSTAWSITPSATVMRFISLMAVMLACYSTALASWHPRRLQQLVLPPLLLVLVISLAIGIVAPDYAIERGTDISLKDAWHGITHGKNEFGMLSSIGLIMCVHRLLARQGNALAALAGAGIALTCLLLSRSNTSLFASIVGCSGMALLLRSRVVARRYTTHVVYAIAGTIVLYELTIQHVIPGVDVLLAPIFQLTGKDSTFSARTVIWEVVKNHIALSPMLGTGYGAYWIGPIPTSPSYIFLSVLWLYPTESHNGYLEIVNDMGFLGLAILAWFLICHMRQGLQFAKVDRPQAVLIFGLLFHQMVMNMSESDWFSLSTTWAIIALSSVTLSRGLLEARLRAPLITSSRAPWQAPNPASAPVPRIAPHRPEPVRRAAGL